MDEVAVRHYSGGLERDRLVDGGDRLELIRTLEPDQRERILRAARLAEHVPAMSAHMLCLARRVS